MRKVIVLLMCAGLVNCSYARKKSPEFEEALIKGAQMKMILRVHDDDGLPVKSAKVRTVVENLYTIYNICGETDTNGTCVVEGVATGNRIEIFIEKDGYYRTHRKYCFITMGAEREVKDGKWQPYGDREEVLLRKIRNPMVLAKSYTVDFRYVNVLHEWIGFDLERNAFVKPFGVGETADFEVQFDWNGKWLPEYTGMGVKVRFAEPMSGYYVVKAKKESEFTGPYEARTNELLALSAEFSEKMMPDKSRKQVHFDDSTCWVVRSRCQVDEKGNLMSANYSVVYGIEFTCDRGRLAGLRVNGRFNPTPNDTNLEAKQ